MGESLNSAKMTDSEIDKYGNYSTGEIAKIIEASLLSDPENADAVGSFINKVQLKEQLMILLMKSIEPQNNAFFENICGICETRMKESGEKKAFNLTRL